MPRTIRAPRGTQLTCKNWLIEAPYRMLQNNLDPDVAFGPDNLFVYGGPQLTGHLEGLHQEAASANIGFLSQYGSTTVRRLASRESRIATLHSLSLS